jgi:HlyD family secretion protein
MPKEIFRKVSIDRLASPEQLDQLLTVTTGTGWLALIALCGTLLAGLAWGVAGTINTTVPGQGVIVRMGGVFNVVTLGAGLVTEVKVKVGDIIKPGQVVAHVAQPTVLEKVRSANADLTATRFAKDRMAEVKETGDKARLAVMEQQKAAIHQEIRNTRDQIRILNDQVPVDNTLLEKGLITKQTALQTQQKIATLSENVSKLEAQLRQIESDGVALRNEVARMDLEHGTRIDESARRVEMAQQELDLTSKVVAANAGRVVEVKVYRGAVVQGGSPILAIEPLEDTLEAIVYVPSSQAKEIQPGMEADVSPSGVKREEYGYIFGKVKAVGKYPATSEAISRTFENEALARSMLSGGPVTELRISFTPDAATVSGFKWSSPKGPPSAVSSGSVCSVDVVTRQEPPISLVIPYLKKELGWK